MNRKTTRTFERANPPLSRSLRYDAWLSVVIRAARIHSETESKGPEAEDWKHRWSLAGMIEEDLEDDLESADGYDDEDEDDDDVL